MIRRCPSTVSSPSLAGVPPGAAACARGLPPGNIAY